MVPALARPVLATPARAVVPDASPSPASLDQELVFIGFDNVFIGITSYTTVSTASPASSTCTGKTRVCFHHRLLLDVLGSGKTRATPCPWHRQPPRRSPRRVSVTLLAHYVQAASCPATSTPPPDYDIDHGIPSRG